jgi:RNA polymerase sigma-70 factor (ECF subfamily)
MSAYKELSDQQLVDLLRSGDKAAYTEIYERYFSILYLHAYKKLRDEEEAKDIIQELFAALWHKRFELHQTNLAGYLFAAVRNRVLDNYAHKQVSNKYISSFQDFLATAPDSSEYLVRERQLSELIEKEIQALPPKMRKIFELSRKAHLSHKEIAEQLQLSEQTVSKQVTNALKMLRIKLGVIVFIMIIVNH